MTWRLLRTVENTRDRDLLLTKLLTKTFDGCHLEGQPNDATTI